MVPEPEASGFASSHFRKNRRSGSNPNPDYEVVDLEGREWMVHRKLLKQMTATEPFTMHPLYVVGVAEESLFWKDIRRVLYSGARFRVLCRLAQDGLQTTWTPVKLADLLGSVIPGLPHQISALGSGTLAAMTEYSDSDGRPVHKQQFMHEALITYAKRLAAHYEHSITEKELAEVGLPSEQQSMSFNPSFP